MYLEVIHTPGHSPGGICLLADGHLFAGDSLFASSIGRTDLPGGDHEQLIAGIREKLLVLPEDDRRPSRAWSGDDHRPGEADESVSCGLIG